MADAIFRFIIKRTFGKKENDRMNILITAALNFISLRALFVQLMKRTLKYQYNLEYLKLTGFFMIMRSGAYMKMAIVK